MINFTNYEAEKYAKTVYLRLLKDIGEEKASLFLQRLHTRGIAKLFSEVDLLDYNITKADIKSISKIIK